MKVVYVSVTNSIGVVLDEGKDSYGKWYRTDCDGVRDSSELLFIHSKKHLKECIKQMGVRLAPSTKQYLKSAKYEQARTS